MESENIIKDNNDQSGQRDNRYYNDAVTLAVNIGCELLSCNCPVGRVEMAVDYMCKALCGNVEISAFAIPSMAVANVRLADGTSVSRMKRIYSMGNDFSKMQRFNQLSRDICAHKYTLEEAKTLYTNLAAKPGLSPVASALSGGIGAGAFTVFYGGSLLDTIPAMLIGGLMAFLACVLSRLAFNGYARTFILSVVGGLGSIAVCSLMALCGLDMHVSTVMMGTIMIVIPGLLICNAIRDLFSGDIYSGSFEILSGILTTLAIVAGYALTLILLEIPALQGLIPPGTTAERVKFGLEDYLYRIIFCFIGTTAFTLFFGGSVKKIIPSIITAMVTFGIWLIMEYFDAIDSQYKILLDMLVATCVAAILSEIFARTQKAPSIIFFVPGIIIFVPGRTLYLTVTNLIGGHAELAAQYGVEMGLVLVGIVAGIIIVTLLFQFINPSLHRRYLRKKINRKK